MRYVLDESKFDFKRNVDFHCSRSASSTRPIFVVRTIPSKSALNELLNDDKAPTMLS